MSELPNWFANVIGNFQRILLPEAGKPDLRYLQLGVYSGDCSVWLAEHVLTAPGSRLYDVDTFEGSADEAGDHLDWDKVYRVYEDKIQPWPVTAFQMRTDDFFQKYQGPPFDFIYIDASHRSENVLRDAVNADYRLRSGGILAFDDYWWGPKKPATERPKEAIDAFFHVRASSYDYLENGQQVWVRKR